MGTIQPSQSDYFQATRGGGNGDYNVIVLAPASVQEMADFVDLAFELSFKYRNPAMILSDGVIGQMMEKLAASPVQAAPYGGRNTPGMPLGRHGSDAWRKPQRAYVARPRQRKHGTKELAFASQIQRNQGKKKSASNPSCAMMQSI